MPASKETPVRCAAPRLHVACSSGHTRTRTRTCTGHCVWHATACMHHSMLLSPRPTQLLHHLSVRVRASTHACVHVSDGLDVCLHMAARTIRKSQYSEKNSDAPCKSQGSPPGSPGMLARASLPRLKPRNGPSRQPGLRPQPPLVMGSGYACTTTRGTALPRLRPLPPLQALLTTCTSSVRAARPGPCQISQGAHLPRTSSPPPMQAMPAGQQRRQPAAAAGPAAGSASGSAAAARPQPQRPSLPVEDLTLASIFQLQHQLSHSTSQLARQHGCDELVGLLSRFMALLHAQQVCARRPRSCVLGRCVRAGPVRACWLASHVLLPPRAGPAPSTKGHSR